MWPSMEGGKGPLRVHPGVREVIFAVDCVEMWSGNGIGENV